MKTKVLVFAISFLAISSAYLFVSESDNLAPNLASDAHESIENGSDPQSNSSVLAGNNDRIPPPPPELLKRQQTVPASDLVAQLTQLIKQQFGESIQDIAVQVSLKGMRNELEEGYPGEGVAMFEQIIRQAFPEHAERILAAISLMDTYDEWLVDNYLDLNDLNALARDNTLWDKRNQLFGEADARKIWSEEIAQDERRERAVKTVMTELDKAYDMSMSDRVYTMQAAMQDNFGSTPEGVLVGASSVTTQLVFRLDSVQKELAELPSEERQETINNMRRQLGFAEERIPALEEMDKKRNAMWSAGLSYMDERDTLLSSYQGEDLETQLDLLRLKHFDDRHAYTVKQEESIGLMRYERDRIYGLN